MSETELDLFDEVPVSTQTPIPPDLLEYLSTLISPPDEQALYLGEMKDVKWDEVKSWKDNSIPGIIVRGQPTDVQSKEFLRVMKPGAHFLLIAPDEQKTGHTGACTIEDAGFEIRDAILWVREPNFHYVPKASRDEREKGCDQLPGKSEQRYRLKSDVSPEIKAMIIERLNEVDPELAESL